ncbi:hypothetical protein C0995_004283 [Termitomyces sp. Mi166|nr:hypothetical protein C0995_004283 [Termitomyces sp. Mi166\
MSPTSPPVSSRHRKVRRRLSSVSPTKPGWNRNAPQRVAPTENGVKCQNSPPATSLGFTPNRPAEDEDIADPSESIRSAPSHRQMFFKEEEKPIPLVYSSLPPSPISTPPPRSYDSPETFDTELTTEVVETKPVMAPFSLWDYLQEELLATDFDSHQEMKWERVSNFLSIPLAMEKIIGFGFIICLDSFLYTFTVQPIRFTFAFIRFLTNMLRSKPPPLPPSQKADILRTLLLVISVLILVPLTDASKIYHTIRGQDTIKLYVIFNALEVHVGALVAQDAMTHALVMVYQLISLNVAINSYDHALLTLLVSNQFVEIKGSVFKKFEKDNLFQITCADIVERFTLALMLCVVAFRNLVELSGSEFDLSEGFVLPKSFGWFRGNNVVWTISYPVLTVMTSEMVVDWLKHAFITKFNHIRPSVYERYADVLCRDLATASAVGRRSARKIGFRVLASCRDIHPHRVSVHFLGIRCPSKFLVLVGRSLTLSRGDPELPDVGDDRSSFLDLVRLVAVDEGTEVDPIILHSSLVIKVILGVNLVSYASKRREGMEAREAADVINNWGRDPIGEGKEERVYNKKLKSLIDNEEDDVPRTAEMGENKPGQQGKKGRVALEDLTRYTMVKRIW